MKTKKIMKFIYLFSFLCLSSGILAQNVTGKITDQDNVPIAGANIVVKGTALGSVSDFDGKYNVNASVGDVLVFSYIGYATQEVTVTSETLDVRLEISFNSLDQITISSSRKPVRKLQATTAINSISKSEMVQLKPETFSEAIQNTPGVTVNEAQGRKGGFSIRGFPGGNVYTSTLIDGLPSSGSANLSSGTQEYYSFDSSVQRIEVVRGAAATLFGRASAAGAVNIISKTGGTEHQGSFALTKYNNVANEGHQFDKNVDYRADINFNGPINEKLRYNVGGFVINDSGQKEQAFKDTGAQIRTNFDWLISDKSKVRFSAGYLNLSFNNNTDTPYDLNAKKPGGGFLNSSTFQNDYRQLYADLPLTGSSSTDFVLDQNGNQIIRNPADFKELSRGGYFGIDANLDLGNGFSINPKFRYQKFNWNDVNDIAFSNFYNADANLFRFLGRSEQDTDDLVGELRLSKYIEGSNSSHNISAGVFYGAGNRDRLGTNVFYTATINPRPELNYFFGERLRSSVTTSHREERSTGLFIGDEMVFNEKLSVNVAFRYDWYNAFFSNDPGEISSTEVDAPINGDELIEIDEKFEDYSFSIGANYLLGESSAVYANFIRAFSLPTVATSTFERPADNEIVNNLEVGFKAGLGDLTVDATIFNTTIDNRVALFLNSTTQEFEPTAAGSNKILGGELALTYAPKYVKGLILRGGVTLQKSEYKDFQIQLSTNSSGETNVDQDGNLFGLNLVGSGSNAAIDISGKQVEQTPKAILNLNFGYNRDRWGADFGGFVYTGRYADATNLYEIPDLSIFNLGGYLTFPMGEDELKLSMRIKNLFDGTRPQSLLATTRDDAALREKQANEIIPEDRYAWAILQNPKRVLFTVEYKF